MVYTADNFRKQIYVLYRTSYKYLFQRLTGMWPVRRNSCANDALFIPSSFLLLLVGLIYVGKSHILASFLSIPGPDPWDLPMKKIFALEEKKLFTSSLNIWPEAWGDIQRET